MKKVVATEFPNALMRTPLEFGRAVRSGRTAEGLTMVEAAAYLQVSKQTLQDLEKGTGTVSLGLAMKISHGLGVSLFATPTGKKHYIERFIEKNSAFFSDKRLPTGELAEKNSATDKDFVWR